MKSKSPSTGKVSLKGDDFICLADVARYKDSERTYYIIQNWLRNRNTIEFLGIWEQLNNPNFNAIEFDGIRKQAGLNSFVLTAKRWIESTASQQTCAFENREPCGDTDTEGRKDDVE
jgi:hypothetical protein